MRHPLANPKWTLPEPGASARLTRAAVLQRVQEHLDDRGVDAWSALTADRWRELLDAADAAELAGEIFARFSREQGRPYFAGCEVAAREDPDRYALRTPEREAEAADPTAKGVLGDGDNVFTAPDLTATVVVVRAVGEVHRLMVDGVPPQTIAVIDDAGGTLTAPILADFDGVICLAGSVRSHLAIIAREFGVPTLMGARLTRPLRTGERITVAYSAAPQRVDGHLGEQRQPRAEIRSAGGAAEA
jgi:phosphohistidine swiveling domain-containing protein